MDENLPRLQLKVNEDSELVELLVHESLYDEFKKGMRILDVMGIAGITGLPDGLEWIPDLLNQFILEYNACGWGISLSIISAICYAIRSAVSIGKFTYEITSKGMRVGGRAGTRLGSVDRVIKTAD